MPKTPLPRYSQFFELLRLTLVLGLLLDLVCAAELVLYPPVAPIWVAWLLALGAAQLAAVSWLAAYDPTSYAGNVWIVIAVRAALAALLWTSVDGFAALAATEFGLAVGGFVCRWGMR